VTTSVVMVSLWRNDAHRTLAQRASHLLNKQGRDVRFLWVVGDSQDQTAQLLARILAQHGRDVTLKVTETGIEGMAPEARLRRLSATANTALRELRPTDDYVVWHESDLLSPVNLVDTLLAHASRGRDCIAGWPTLRISHNLTVFYDVWAYRKDGLRFTNTPPYHACYRKDEPFEVDSFGCLYMFPAAAVRAGAHFTERHNLGLCELLRAQGRQLWVDPTLAIQQPLHLWTPQPASWNSI
jgi:hypothetical protein